MTTLIEYMINKDCSSLDLPIRKFNMIESQSLSDIRTRYDWHRPSGLPQGHCRHHYQIETNRYQRDWSDNSFIYGEIYDYESTYHRYRAAVILSHPQPSGSLFPNLSTGNAMFFNSLVDAMNFVEENIQTYLEKRC